MKIDLTDLGPDEAAKKLAAALQKTYPEELRTLARGLGAKTLELWRSRLENASSWGRRAASTIGAEATGDGMRIFHDPGAPEALFYNMIENGVRARDLKEALLSGKRAKKSKSGKRYAVVPFRHRTPGKGKSTSSFASVMPGDVHALARAGKQVGPEYGRLSGLKKYGEGAHSRYMTFRVVTDDSQGWHYPAIHARPQFDGIESASVDMASRAVAAWASKKAGELVRQ